METADNIDKIIDGGFLTCVQIQLLPEACHPSYHSRASFTVTSLKVANPLWMVYGSIPSLKSTFSNYQKSLKSLLMILAGTVARAVFNDI